MADVITRFKLETTQYDSKLRDASQGLSKLSQQLQIAGKEFDRFAQKDVEVAKAFGQIESGATNLKDKLKDLVGAYNNVAKAYNQLTNEQKSTDFGKAMASSLDQLKGRITQTKTELYSMNEGSNKLGDSISALASKFGLNIKQLSAWGAAIAAIKGSLDVMKDAFFASESNVDEWGRVVESSESIYNSFLQTLNNGDFSGFFTRIQDVIDKSREAYNALDELQTRGGIVSSERLRLQARQTELKSIIRRYGADSAEGKAAQAELRQLEVKLNNAYKTEQQLNYNAFKQRVDEKLEEAGINLNKKSYDFLMRSFSDDSVYNTLKKNANGAKVFGTDTYTVDNSNPLNLKRIDPRNTEQKLLDLFTDEWRKTNKPLLDASFSARNAAASSLLGDARYLRQGGGGSGIGGNGGTIQEIFPEGSLKQLQQEMKALQDEQALVTSATAWQQYQTKIDDVSKRIDALKGKVEEIELLPDLDVAVSSVSPLEALKDKIRTELAESSSLIDETTLATLLKTSIQNGLEGLDLDFSSIQEKMYEGLNITDEQWRELQDKINEKLKELGIEPIKIDFETGNVSSSDKSETSRETYGVDAISKVSSGINSMVASIDQLGVEIPSGLKEVLGGINAIVSILTTISAIMEAIEAIQSATSFMPFFAKGGIVPHAARGFVIPGNDHTDMTPILAQSGELILNRAAQGNIASMLNDSQKASGGTPYVSGEQIFLGLTNYLARTGRGEIITSRG